MFESCIWIHSSASHGLFLIQIEQNDVGSGGMSKAESTTMLCEPPASPEEAATAGGVTALTLADIQLICDLFYLPCEHGPKVR
jgi:hypothetical protein